LKAKKSPVKTLNKIVKSLRSKIQWTGLQINLNGLNQKLKIYSV
jgi:hypothetical protein